MSVTGMMPMTQCMLFRGLAQAALLKGGHQPRKPQGALPMNGQNQTYLCIREVGTEYLLQPAGQEPEAFVAGKTDNVWYFITSRPLASFNFLGSFGAYRDLQAAFSAMALVDPLVQRAEVNNSL